MSNIVKSSTENKNNTLVLLNQEISDIQLNEIKSISTLYENPLQKQSLNSPRGNDEAIDRFTKIEGFPIYPKEQNINNVKLNSVYENKDKADFKVRIGDTQEYDYLSDGEKYNFLQAWYISENSNKLLRVDGIYAKDGNYILVTTDKKPRFYQVTPTKPKVTYKRLRNQHTFSPIKPQTIINIDNFIKIEGTTLKTHSNPPVEITDLQYYRFYTNNSCIYSKENKLYTISFDAQDSRNTTRILLDEYQNNQKVVGITTLEDIIIVSVEQEESKTAGGIRGIFGGKTIEQTYTSYFYNLHTRVKLDVICPDSDFIQTTIYDPKTGLPCLYNKVTNSLIGITPVNEQTITQAKSHITSPIKIISNELGLTLRTDFSFAHYSATLERKLQEMKDIYENCFKEDTNNQSILNRFMKYCQKEELLKIELTNLKSNVALAEYRKSSHNYISVIEESSNQVKNEFFNYIRDLYIQDTQKNEIMTFLSSQMSSSSDYIKGLIHELIEYVKSKPISF